jgi:Centromere DNA-binding protein complex CBF3 subunit, domain 2/Transcriptional activator of glycolytic enzymes
MSLDAYNEAISASTITAATAVAGLSLPNPNSLNVAVQLRENVWRLLEGDEPENTRKAMEPKMKEFMYYCHSIYPTDPHYGILTKEKIYNFMFYVAFREAKQKGGRRPAQSEAAPFDFENYQMVLGFADRTAGITTVQTLPQPSKPVSKSTFDQYKAMLRKVYRIQKMRGVLSAQWDDLWTNHCDSIRKHVLQRAPKKKKETYQEKMSGEFAPYTFVERFGEIEEGLWADSNKSGNHRSVTCGLRHRYCLLHLTSGILRSESLHRAELSDFCGINVPSNDRDAHPMFVMVNQIPFGKTNHGRVLYGRATRHKDVKLCAVGALSFYLQYRFHVTDEFINFTVDDWCDNSKWFDVKLLVDVGSPDRSKEMKNDSYSKCLLRILNVLGLPTSILVHLGRKVGPKILDCLETESADIQRLGNWNPSLMDSCYSSKIPLTAIRAIAGFPGKTNFYYNRRTTVDPPTELLKATPIGKWVYKAHDEVKEKVLSSGSTKHQTAYQVLCFLMDLNKFFLQDAAAMMVLDETRASHSLFQQLSCFDMEQWVPYRDTMKAALVNDDCPLDAKLENVIPGLHQWHRANDQALKSVIEAVDNHMTGLRETLSTIQDTQVAGVSNIKEEIARSFACAAVSISPRHHVQASTQQKCPPRKEFDSGLDELADLFGNEPTSETTMEVTTNTNSVMTRRFFMKAKHQTLRSLYEEWYGIGNFADCDGGIDGRERKLGPNWRKHIDRQQFSRASRVVAAIQTVMKQNGLTWEAAVEKLEPMFASSNQSTAKMVENLQTAGILRKGKPRGSNSKSTN